MKRFFFLTINLLFYIASQAQQNTQSINLVFVACKEGTLLIDGAPIATLTADDAFRKDLSFGEHYIQLKTASEKFSTTIHVTSESKAIIKLGCAEENKVSTQRLLNKEVSLVGLLSSNMEQNLYALDKEDELLINSSVINPKGTATIFISDINSGAEIYRRQDFRAIENQKVRIPQKGIYKVSIYTDALFGKEAKLALDRIPAATSDPKFNSTPIVKADTVATEVLKTIARVYSSSNLSNSNRTSIKINLPPGTSYWCYWIGVDQPAQDAMKNFTQGLGPVLSAFSANPLVLYGMKLIPSLPMVQAPSTVSYKFMDSKNANAFVSGQAYSYYQVKHATNVSTDYSLINAVAPDIVLGMENLNISTGYNVDVRVVAFVVKKKLVIDE